MKALTATDRGFVFFLLSDPLRQARIISRVRAWLSCKNAPARNTFLFTSGLGLLVSKSLMAALAIGRTKYGVRALTANARMLEHGMSQPLPWIANRTTRISNLHLYFARLGGASPLFVKAGWDTCGVIFPPSYPNYHTLRLRSHPPSCGVFCSF
ncbi:hypothetical protein F5887DRAFT_564833 [Amanita rubescens]|nr:hypothetical protein F5887DRAFT_564833 [Amanita rubescens]